MWSPLDWFSVESWILIVSILALAKYYMHRKWQYLRNINIPHDPPSLAKCGNFLEMFDPKVTFKIDNMMKKKYGPIWGSYALFTPGITIHDPDILRQIYIKEFNSFPHRQDRLNNINGKEMNDGLVSVEGKQWKRIRSSLTPTFSTAKLKQMIYIMDRCVDNTAKALDRKIENSCGVFSSKTIFSRLSLDIVCSAAFSTDVNSQDDTIKEPEIAKQAKNLLNSQASAILMFICFLFPLVGKIVEFLGISIFGAEPVGYFKALTNHVINQRESNPHMDVTCIVSTMMYRLLVCATLVCLRHKDKILYIQNRKVDLMQLMLNNEISEEDAKSNRVEKGLSRNEIVGNSILMILGGYENTGNTMSFLAYNLAMHPETQKKVQEEIDEMMKTRGSFDYESVNSLKYLEMCVHETLRIYNPILRNARLCSKDVTINGLTITKGMAIAIPTFALSHDPDYWDEPEKFKPERMRDMSQIDPMMFQPFGAGPRNCIAMRFALTEVKLSLAKLMYEFTFEPADCTPKPPLELEFAMTVRAAVDFNLRTIRRRRIIST